MQSYRHSKLGQNRNINNVSNNQHPQLQPYHCRNHPDKVATHSLMSNQSHQQLTYCEKCSIMLASQNFNVIKIGNNKPSPPLRTHKTSRQVQVEYFLGEIAQQIERIQHKKIQVESHLKTSEDNYARALAEITAYFREIETIIQIQKYRAYNSVLSERRSIQSELRTVRESISSQLQSLEGISSDIENNIEAVLSVEEDIYETIMQNYCSKLDISTQVEQIEIGHVSQPLCLFSEVPKALYYLADGIQLRSNYMEPSPSPKRADPSFKQSMNSSRVTAIRHDEFLKQANSQVSMGDIYRRSSQELQENYSFDNGTSLQGQMQRVLFFESAAQKKLLPHQVPFRESLNLTQIRQNEEELIMRRFTSLEQTIPEEMQSSRQSIEAYLIGSTDERSKEILKADSRAQDTQTLLIS